MCGEEVSRCLFPPLQDCLQPSETNTRPVSTGPYSRENREKDRCVDLGEGHLGKGKQNRLTVMRGRHMNTNLKLYSGQAFVEKGRKLPLCVSAKDLGVPPNTTISSSGSQKSARNHYPTILRVAIFQNLEGFSIQHHLGNKPLGTHFIFYC